jgi:iron complex outermembrane receptor protein
VGSTTNPKIGLTYKPVDSVRLRAAWGKSFVAPSLITSPLIDPGNPLYIPSAAVAFLQPPASLIASGRYPAVLPGQNTLLILGSAPGIKPQTAKTASFGVDFDPPFVPGLNLSLTYWKIDYSDVIALPGFTDQLNFWSNLGAFITVAPTLTQINAVNALASGAVTTCTPLPGCVYAIMDARKTNLGLFLLRGLDFAAHYARPTGFGSLDFSVNANYELKREQSAAAGAPLIDLIKANVSRFRGSASAGAEVGKLRTQATLYHTQGYGLNPGVGIGQVQTHVSSFDVVNLFFKYDVSHEGMYKDLAVTLNVDNILDRDPPVFQQNNITPNVDGYVNGWTLGRVVQLGVSKKF